MGKWIAIQDFRDKPSYGNVKARIVYLHAACCCDVGTYVATTSLRRLARELDMTVDAIRYALKLLQQDGLIEVSTSTPQKAPQLTPQKAPHLTYITIKRLQPPNTTESTTTYTTDSTTEYKEEKIKKIFTPTNARECAGKLKATAISRFGIEPGEAAALVEDFIGRQVLKKHAWSDEGDMAAHFIAWIEKRLPRQKLPANSARTDHEARVLERKRTEEEVRKETAEEKEHYELEKLRRWLKEALTISRENTNEEIRERARNQAKWLREAIAEKEARK